MKRRRARGLAGAVAAVALAGVGLPRCQAAAANPLTSGPGLRPATSQEWALVREVLAPSVAKTVQGRRGPLPAAVKNHLYLPAVRNQQLNNCGPYATTYYYKTYQEARERGWPHPDPATNPERVMSPGFTYPLANGGENAETSLPFLLWVLCRFGAATWASMPENTQDWWSWPTEEQWRNAMPHRGAQVIAFDSRSDAGLAEIKAHLASGDLAVMSVRAYYDTHVTYPDGTGIDSGVIHGHGTQSWYQHGFTLIGYDDARAYHDGSAPRTGAFLAVNSWGPNWGVTDPDVGTGGFVWFAYDYVKSAALSESAVYAMTDRIGYVPQDTATIDLQHPRRNELAVGLRDGFSTNWLSSFPNVGASPFQGRIVVDVTDFASNDPYAYWLSASDVPGDPGDRGWITAFAVTRSNGLTLTSLDAPAQTVDWSPTNTAIRLAAGLIRPTGVTFDDGVGSSAGNHQMDEFAGAWADWNLDGQPDLALAGNRFAYAPDFARLHANARGAFYRVPVSPPLNMAAYGATAWADFDGDGDPDLAMTGLQSNGVASTRLYRNRGPLGFTNVSVSLPALSAGTLAWGDYDNDGDPDLALCGLDAGSAALIRLYRNTGGTNFANTGIVFPEAERGAMAWADVNNDGWLDLSIGNKVFRNNGDETFADWRVTIPGRLDGSHAWGDFNGDGRLDLAACELNSDYTPARPVLTIYGNYGEFFVDSFPPGFWVLLLGPTGDALPGLYDASLAWADFDNDGRLDLVASGATGQDGSARTLRRTMVLRQESTGAFRDIGVDVPGVGNGLTAWVDTDGDGDLDLFAAGREADSANRSSARMYGSAIADGDGLDRPNTPPTPPLGLSVTQSNGTCRLTWDPATDDETPAASLSYEVRAGTQPGLADTVSPAGAVGLLGGRGHARIAPGQPGLLLNNLPAGRYYWSVQAIDGGLCRSEWSGEHAFTVTSAGLRNGDLNGDGVLDVADLVRCRKMIRGEVPPSLPLADMTADGKLDENDTRILVKMLLALGVSDYIPLRKADIGGAGGTLASDGFELTVPAGAFAGSATLELLASSDDKPFGAASPKVMFRVTGMPVAYSQPLTVRLTGSTTNAGVKAYLGLGTRGFATGGRTEPTRGFVFLECTVGGDRVPTFTIPAAATGKRTTRAASTLRGDPPAAARWEWDAGGLFSDGVLTAQSAHFKTVRPCPWTTRQLYAQQLTNLISDLEWAYSRLPEAGFSFASRRTWPVSVTVMEGTPAGSDLGHAACSILGDNHGYLQFDYRLLTDRAAQRTTASHEFCHLVMSLYDPRTAYMKAKSRAAHYWFEEAVATWAERYGADAPASYASDNYKGNRDVAFRDGMVCPTLGAAKGAVASHGYGMAALPEHLATNRTPAVIGAVFDQIATGSEVFDAIATATADAAGDFWCHGFYNEWVKGALYASESMTLDSASPEHNRFKVASVADQVAAFTPRMPGMGTEVYGTFIDVRRPAFAADEVMAFSLRGNGRQKLQIVTAYRDANRLNPANLIAAGNVAPNSARCFLPDLEALRQAGRSVYALVTSNDRANPCIDVTQRPRLLIGFARPVGGATALPSFTSHAPNIVNLGFPSYQCSGSVTLDNSYGSYTSLVSEAAEGRRVDISLAQWKDGALSCPVSFNASIAGVSFETNRFGHRLVYTVTSQDSFRLTKRVYPDWNVSRQGTVGGSFTADLQESEDGASFCFEARYGLKEEEFDAEGKLISSRDFPHLNFALLDFYIYRR